ncbi:hypothetical protein [Streptomyces sp. NPDC018693]|uniref:hypothetical protein n=1 Tax=unclassified Streptomyces TaxID=2593676 RepID=UPI0037AD696E
MVLGSDLKRGTAGRGTALAAALVLILAPALAACGDDDDGGNGTTATPTLTPPPAQTETELPTASPTAPADRAAAERDVRQNWEKFFDPKTSVEDKQDVLENGDQMAPVLRAFSGDERGGQSQAEVTKVEFTSPTEATVTYDLLVAGATALPDASGKAVQQDGTWKVSVSTLCALVALSGNGSPTALPGC